MRSKFKFKFQSKHLVIPLFVLSSYFISNCEDKPFQPEFIDDMIFENQEHVNYKLKKDTSEYFTPLENTDTSYFREKRTIAFNFQNYKK